MAGAVALDQLCFVIDRVCRVMKYASRIYITRFRDLDNEPSL